MTRGWRYKFRVMATAIKPQLSIREPRATGLPPLENGDRLTRAEFERRYEAMPELKKAELIEGIVYMGSPVRNALHGEPHATLMLWLGLYGIDTPGVRVSDNPTVRLDLENEPQPDAILRLLPDHGGRTRDTAEGYIEGGPELVAEIAASSASYDLHQKKAVFRRAGVPEYLVWITRPAEIRWFVLEDDDYADLAPDEDGILKSRVFPGLWLDPAALLSGDHAKVREVLQQGLGSAVHAEFVKRAVGA